jgi:hypothetical protein
MDIWDAEWYKRFLEVMRFGKTSILPFEIGTNNMKEGRDMNNDLVNTDFFEENLIQKRTNNCFLEPELQVKLDWMLAKKKHSTKESSC